MSVASPMDYSAMHSTIEVFMCASRGELKSPPVIRITYELCEVRIEISQR